MNVLCMYVCMYLCMYVCMYVCMYICMHACMHACMHVCMYACMHVCMYACMHVCMYVCMYVCMCVYMLQNVIIYLQWAAPSWTIYGARPKGTGRARPVMHLCLLLLLYSNIFYPYPILFAIDPLASAYLLVATRFSLSLSVIDTVSSFSCS